MQSDNKNSVPIPPEVTDDTAYIKMLECQETLDSMELDIPVSDTSLRFVKISTSKDSLFSKISHLPDDERESIIAKFSQYKALSKEKVSLRNKAFGFKQGGVYSLKTQLLDGKKSEILHLFGSFHSDKEVHKIVNQKFGLNVSLALIKKFQRDNINEINELQEEHKSNFDDVRLSHKKSRLVELNELYIKAKSTYDVTSNREDLKTLMMLIKAIKDEVEGNTLVINGKLQIDMQATIAIQAQKEVLAKTTLLDVIIGRVSARLGVNPAFLLNRMHRSIYANLTGFGQGGDEFDKNPNTFLDYPSLHNYDLDRLKQLFGVAKAVENRDVKFPDVTDIEVVEESRQKLLGKRDELKDKLDNLKDNVE